MNSSTNDSSTSETTPIPSADIIHLILGHLTESGLHETCTTLRHESGLGMAGIFPTSKGHLISSIEEGRWGEVLEILDCLDLERYKRGYLDDYNKSKTVDSDNQSNLVTPLEKALALAHEMTVLELADHGEYDLAYATLRMCSELLDRTLPSSNEHDMDEDDVKEAHDTGKSSGTLGIITSRTGDIERRITALTSLRTTSKNVGRVALDLPTNYYGPSNQTQQKRRSQIVKLMKNHIPELPVQRLSSLLQQSLRWQCHTGVYPAVQRLFLEKDGMDENEGDLGNESKGKKKKRKKQASEQKFDLVLGNVDVSLGGGKKKHKTPGGKNSEHIPSRPTQTVRLGKKSYIESAIFLPDGKGLITGSSDGFIEIWGEKVKDGTGVDSMIQSELNFEKLRTSDLLYQKNDELMMVDAPVIAMDISHDGALLGTATTDGTVCVWKIMDGKLLRKLERAHGGSGVGGDKGAAVSCIQFSPDGSKILTGGHDYTCREFGLLASRMLKEFRGHKSYVNCCSYIAMTPMPDDRHTKSLSVVTGSADGKVIIWDARHQSAIREISPPVPMTSATTVHESQSIVASNSIHTILHLHSPPQTMIIVPRSDRAYLMSYTGSILRVFTRDDVQGTDFLTASVSPSNQWLYIAADDGKCVVFDINSGSVEKIIRSFAEECSTRSEKASDITGIIHHPHYGMIGGFCNDKGQKRGILTIWK